MNAEIINACKVLLYGFATEQWDLLGRALRPDSPDVLISGRRFQWQNCQEGRTVEMTGSVADAAWLHAFADTAIEFSRAPLTLPQRLARVEKHLGLPHD